MHVRQDGQVQSSAPGWRSLAACQALPLPLQLAQGPSQVGGLAPEKLKWPWALRLAPQWFQLVQ